MSKGFTPENEQGYFKAYTHVRRSINTVWKIISEEMSPFKINVMAIRTPPYVLNKIKGAYRNSIKFSFNVGMPSFDKFYLIVFHTDETEIPNGLDNEKTFLENEACSILTMKGFVSDKERVHFEKDTYFTDSDSVEPHPIVINLISKAKRDMAFESLHRKVYECLVMRNDYTLQDVKDDGEPFF
ncbi:hypothetical protein EYS14_00180 [Alteromonadaceae bacterium M269]|nr:hypothetical protein EYS14_00180 [Alteromonadaceae bacterium M269]